MPSNDNTVNIKPVRRGYHFGDLRAAALAEAMKQLAIGPPDQLSLREVARNLGVSATALYRHFPDKQAMLQALADEGDRRLDSMQRQAYDAACGGVKGFVATGKAYVRFALQNPALFRLLNSCAHEASQRPGANVVRSRSMSFLRENIANLLPGDAGARRRQIEIVKAWAQVHGLAMLMLDGALAVDEDLIDAVIAGHAPAAADSMGR